MNDLSTKCSVDVQKRDVVLKVTFDVVTFDVLVAMQFHLQAVLEVMQNTWPSFQPHAQ